MNIIEIALNWKKKKIKKYSFTRKVTFKTNLMVYDQTHIKLLFFQKNYYSYIKINLNRAFYKRTTTHI